MSAIAAGWLTLAVLATADPTAAIRLLMLAAAALALFVFGWVMTGLSQAVAQACQETAIIAALAVMPLALWRGAPPTLAAVIGVVLLPLGATALATTGGADWLAIGLVAAPLAGIGAIATRRRAQGWIAAAGIAVAAVAAGAGTPLPGIAAASLMAVGAAFPGRLPRGLPLLLTLPCLLPIAAALAARDPWLLAPFCAAIGLIALGFLRPRP